MSPRPAPIRPAPPCAAQAELLLARGDHSLSRGDALAAARAQFELEEIGVFGAGFAAKILSEDIARHHRQQTGERAASQTRAA